MSCNEKQADKDTNKKDIDEDFERYMKGSCHSKIYKINGKIDGFNEQIQGKMDEIEDIEEKIAKKKKKIGIYERMSTSESRKQFFAIKEHIIDIDDSDNEVDLVDEIIKIKYDLDGEECSHEQACNCK